jgi:uncharacterized protein (DUF1800 family)
MSDDVALLLTRAGFGPTRQEIAAAQAQGYAATLVSLTAPARPDAGAAQSPLPNIGIDSYHNLVNPTKEQLNAANRARSAHNKTIMRWWLDRMTIAEHQAVEKLGFFWHGHWAVSQVKVGSPQLMLAYVEKLRSAPDVKTLAHRMVTDPAMVLWLDGQINTKHAPNENFGRELMELFLLGVGNYTEKDVQESARALTGWRVSLSTTTSATLAPADHDGGNKTILGVTQKFGAASLVDLLLRQPTCPRFIAERMWFRYATSDEPIPRATRDRMVAAFPSPLLMLRALFGDEAFLASRGKLVKQPVEWLVGAMRHLGLRPATFAPEVLNQLIDGMRGMGQLPYNPPSVGGWPAGAAWLTSAAADARLRLASLLVDQAKLPDLTMEQTALVLGLDGWSDRTYAALKARSTARERLILGLLSPEYVVS